MPLIKSHRLVVEEWRVKEGWVKGGEKDSPSTESKDSRFDSMYPRL